MEGLETVGKVEEVVAACHSVLAKVKVEDRPFHLVERNSMTLHTPVTLELVDLAY